MHLDLSHIYFYSDIDGTLGIAGEPIPTRNIEAVKQFINWGGHFGVATGRWISELYEFLQEIPVNLPCIVNNGGSIYDYNCDNFLLNRTLPDTAPLYFQEIQNDYPLMDFYAVNQDDCYYCHRPGVSPLFQKDFDTHPKAEFETLSGPFVKFFFLTESIHVQQIVSELGVRKYPDVQFIQSSTTSFDMVPVDCNKGSALLKVCEMLEVPVSNTVFIGDNYNDKEIFQAAGFSAGVASTPKELHPLCDIVMGNCMAGAVAELLEAVEKLTLFPMQIRLSPRQNKSRIAG